MPTETITLYPGNTYDLSFGGEATASWDIVAPTNDKVDDPKGAAPDGQFGEFTGAFATAKTAYAEYGLASVPSGVSVAAVRLFAGVAARNTGPGTYTMSVEGLLRPAGTGVGSSGAYFGTPQTFESTPADGVVIHELSLGEWLTDPATSLAFTLSTLQVMKWGAKFAAPASDPAVNARIRFEWIRMEVDLVRIAADIDGVRAVGSAHLRLFRREPDLFEITGPALLADVAVMELFGLEHPLAPRPDGRLGWGPKLWQRALGRVISKTYDVMGSTVKLAAHNPRLYWTRWWSTFLTDLGFSLDGQGIPLLHSGSGGIRVDRNQVAYVERSGKPPDGRQMAVDEDRPKYDRRGLLVEGGGAQNAVLNSTFSQGSGDAFTNWTPVETGTGQVLESTSDFQFDEPGLRRSAHLLVGATDASEAHLAADAVVLPSGKGRLRIRTKNLFGAGKLAATIQRLSDSEYLDAETGTWDSPVFYNRIGEDGGGYRDWHAYIDAGGPDNVVVDVGYFAESGTQDFQALATSVEVYADAKLIGSDLPVTDTPITRVADGVLIQNNENARAWEPEKGSFNLTVNPLWDPDDLDENEEKVFWAAELTEDDFDEILFRKSTGSNRVIFRRLGVEAFVPFTPTKLVPFKISVRWVEEGGELDLPVFTHQVAVDNVWGNDAALESVVSIDPIVRIFVGSNGDDSWADAFLSHADVSPLVLTDEELARRP